MHEPGDTSQSGDFRAEAFADRMGLGPDEAPGFYAGNAAWLRGR